VDVAVRFIHAKWSARGIAVGVLDLGPTGSPFVFHPGVHPQAKHRGSVTTDLYIKKIVQYQ
jgi:hypothetical protein